MPELIDQLALPEIGADRFIRYHELQALGVPYSRQHLAVLEGRGAFPRRVSLSTRVIAWRLSELRAWMDTRGRRG